MYVHKTRDTTLVHSISGTGRENITIQSLHCFPKMEKILFFLHNSQKKRKNSVPSEDINQNSPCAAISTETHVERAQQQFENAAENQWMLHEHRSYLWSTAGE